MTHEDINRALAEAMGKHVFEEVERRTEDGLPIWNCKTCKAFRAFHPPDPDYLNSLPDVFELQEFVIEKVSVERFAQELSKIRHCDVEQDGTYRWRWFDLGYFACAPAEERARACFEALGLTTERLATTEGK